MLKGISRKRKQFLSCGDCGKQFASEDLYDTEIFPYAKRQHNVQLHLLGRPTKFKVVDILLLKTIVFSSGSLPANFLCHGKFSHDGLYSDSSC